MSLVSAAATLLAGLIGIREPSFTRAETATLAAVHRSFPQLIRMLSNVDVVHGAYYVLIWAVVRVAGSGELALRLPSALAMAVAAGFVAALGRRLVSSWAGLAAGLTFAALPSVSWFAENAREGAIVAALAAIATYCLVRALHAGQEQRRWPARSQQAPAQLSGPAEAAPTGRTGLRAWVAVCLPWLILPLAILLAASLAHPVYTFRYIVYCIPAAALLLGAALAALGRYAGPAALVAIVLIGLHTQILQRRPDGHRIDIRAADRIVATHARPGDALLNISARNGPRKGGAERTLDAAYPYGLARLRDISTGVSPEKSGTLGGTYASSQQIHERLESVKRLWVVEWTTPKPVATLDDLRFRLVHRWDVKSLWLRFYTRRHVA